MNRHTKRRGLVASVGDWLKASETELGATQLNNNDSFIVYSSHIQVQKYWLK